MNPGTTIATFLIYAALAGLLGALAMITAMKLTARSGWAMRDSMIVAVGSMFTRRRENAWPVGCIVHALSAVVFAQIYGALLIGLQLATWPHAFYAGLGLGFFHGLVMSLALCWVVADRHPLAEFRNAGMSVAVVHLIGHLAYGAVVGLVFALAPVPAA